MSSNAQIWNHHGTAFLQVRKSHICTKEAQRKITSSCGSPEKQVWLRMTTLTIFNQLALCQMQHNAWQRGLSSSSSTALKFITACRWRINGQWKCLHSISPAEPFPTKDLHKVLADLCLLFQFSCVSIWTQLSKLTNVLNRWTTLESQPILLRNSPGTFGQSSSAFAQPAWNWKLRNATSESDKLNS